MGDILKFLSETPTDNPDQKPSDLYAEKGIVDFLAQPDPLPSAVEKGLVTPPDQAANVIRLQAKTGLPQGVIERNIDYVEAEANKQGFNATEFRKNNPKLADWLAQTPNHVALAKADIEGMSAIETAFATLKSIPYGFKQGMDKQYLMSELTWNKLIESADQNEPLRQQMKSEQGKEYQTGLPSWTRSAADILGMNFQSMLMAAKKEGTIGLAGGASAGAALGLVGGPGAPATVTAGAAIGGTTGFSVGMTTGYMSNLYKMSVADVYSDLEDVRDEQGNPIDPTVVKYASLIVGLPNAALETFALGKAIKLIPGADKVVGAITKNQMKQLLIKPTVREALKDFGKKYATAIASETITEGMQKFLNIITREIAQEISGQTYKPYDEKQKRQDIEAIFAESTEAFKGMVVLGTLGAGPKTIETYKDIKKSQQNEQFIRALGENLNSSTLLNKSPEAVKSYIEHLKKDGDIQNVYIPVEAWDKLFQMDSGKAITDIIGSSNQYAEAKAVNGDIIIPLEVYAEKIAGTTFHDQLMPDITFKPGEMSARDAEKAVKNQDKEIEKESKSIEDSYKANDPVRKVYNDVYGQHIALGTTRQEADRMATLVSQRQAAWADLIGKDAYELWQEKPIGFQRELPAVLRNKEVDIHLDPLLDQLRSGKSSTQKEIFGSSLIEFLKGEGGLLDQGTELSTMDVDVERRRSAKKLVQKEGMTLDNAAALANEQGYIDESDINKLLDAIDRETRGEPVYVPGKENQDLLNRDKELNDLNDYLNSIGADLKTMDNAAVRKLVKEHEAKSDLYQSAFHGSPYKFDKFTLDHIGKGEGAQAYGWGLYFAGNKQVAEYYREALAPPAIIKNWSFGSVRLVKNEEYQDYSPRDGSALQQAKALLSEDLLIQENEIRTAFEKEGIESARKVMLDVADNRIDMAKEDQPDIIPHLKVLRSRIQTELKFDVDVDKGQTYEVNIPDDDEYLFWDKPLSEQSEKVKTALNGLADISSDQEMTRFMLSKPEERTTGGALYRGLSAQYDEDSGDKKASELLKSVGVAGIKYFDGNSRGPQDEKATYNYVIFDDKSIEIIDTYYQTEFNAPSGSTSVPPLTGFPEDALGMYSRDSHIITYFKRSNPSTGLHELGHAWLEEMRIYAQREDAPQKLLDMWATVQKEYGITEDKIPAEAHEKFARSFETYVMTGKSPSVELHSVFSNFKNWLLKIYKSIAPGEVSPAMREVFDRMLATDEQIALAREIQGYAKPLLDEAGMTKVEYEAYQKINEKAKVEAEDSTRAKVMGELLREQSAWWKKARSVMREEVSAEINAIPTYRALSWLRKGVFPDGSTLEGIEPMKLSKDALVQRYGAPFLASLPKPYIYQIEGGLHPDMAAEYLGFGTGEELVKALAEAKPRNELIDAETDQRMKSKYGDMMIDGTIADEADFQVNNDRQAEVFMYEMKVLKRRGSTHNISPKEVFQQIARSVIQDKKVGDLDPKYYEHAARRAGQEAEKALLGKDMKLGVARNLDLAFEAKQRQLLNLYLFKEAFIAKTKIESAQDRFLDMFKKDEKLAKTRNMDMVNAARAISAQHGIGGTEQNAMAYLEQMREYDSQTYEDMKMVVDLAISDSKPFKQLTVAEFGLVQDSIDGLWELSRLSQQITIEGKKLQLKTVIAELNGKMELLGEPKAKRGYDKAVTKWEKTKIGLLGAKAALRRVELWVDAMDQGNFNGEFRRYIWQPISDATTHFREMRRQTLEKYLDLVKPIEGTITRDKIAAPELGYTFGEAGSGRSELLGALLHTGNESNLQRLLTPLHWGEYREDGTLDTSKWDAFIQRMHNEGILTKRDYDFVQSIWDLNESLKPDAQKAHKAMYGYYFAELTAQKLITPFGEYSGGYMPAIYDPFKSDDAALRSDKEALEGQSNSFMFPTTGRGFTKSRKAGYAKPLVMDLRYIPSHLDKVLKFTYIEPRVKEVGRLVMNKEFKAGLADYVDTEVSSQMLVPWLQRAARQTVETASMDRTGRLFDKFWKEVRSRTGLQIMTLNVTNALQQFTGLSIAAIKVKPSFLASSLGRYVRGPFEYAGHISEKSEFMRNRVYSQSFEIQEKIDNILLDPTKLEKARDFAIKHGYFLQAGTQHVVDLITWGGAYDQAIANGDTERVAVMMADSAVRETQGTFAAEDISRFETGSPFMRAFTMFYTYFNMQANMLGTEFSKAMKQGGFGGAGRGLYVYTFGFMIPAVISELIVQAMSGKLTDDEDEDWADWLSIFFGGQGRTVSAMVPGIGPAIQTGINSFNDKWYDDRMSTSPAVSMIESTVHAPFSIYNATQDGSQKKAIKDTLTAVGMATGLPLAALGRPLGYLADMEQGKVEPSGPIDLTRGLITGKSK